jgi:uncharacterized protein YdiU (UPF0061 family)
MPTDGTDDWGQVAEAVSKRRAALIAKWRAMGCTEGKILTLMQRRIRSRRQWW